MAEFLFETKGKTHPHGKPRVFFTCHPDDFDQCFKKICGDILATHDCAIYYTKDPNEPFTDSEKDTDLGSMNLFVIPVTFRLLTEENRAMGSDFPYAKEEGIPILPIMLESGIDAFYAAPDRFGQLQYLDPYSNDVTAIKYEEKLKKYLDSVLISDELANRIRAAFDAYIFLSYRKIDRKYANELMRLIHRIPFCRDLAVWYDEFLTPGESFQASIGRILSSSKLLALLVTPNILEEPNGKPNYVMGTEYPEAVAMGKSILPVEMEKTDRTALEQKFIDIPACVGVEDEDAFREHLSRSLADIASCARHDDPAHNFLIGLAYLDGIDMEMDRERGRSMILDAAENGLPEAIKKAYTIYDSGIGITPDYQAARQWAEKLYLHYQHSAGPAHPDTLDALDLLAAACGKLGDYKEEVALNEKNYLLRCQALGTEHLSTLKTQDNLALSYGNLGNYGKEAELEQQIYDIRRKLQGEDHPDTLRTLGNLSMAWGNYGNYQKAGKMLAQAYALFREKLGEEHPDTLCVLSNLAGSHYRLGDYRKATQLNEKIYRLRLASLPEEHPDTITAMANLAFTYGKLGDYRKELEMEERVYALRCKVMGKNHPRSLLTLGNMAMAHSMLGNYEKAVELNDTVYALRRKILGEEHPDTLVTLSNIAEIHGKLGNYQKEAELDEKIYEIRCKVLGPNHPKAILTLGDLAFAYGKLGDRKKAVELETKVYALRCRLLGQAHPDTLSTLETLAHFHGNMGDLPKEKDMMHQVLTLRRTALGTEHPDTIRAAQWMDAHSSQ